MAVTDASVSPTKSAVVVDGKETPLSAAGGFGTNTIGTFALNGDGSKLAYVDAAEPGKFAVHCDGKADPSHGYVSPTSLAFTDDEKVAYLAYDATGGNGGPWYAAVDGKPG